MNREEVKTPSEKMVVYQTILSSPGMNENVKLQLHISRQNIVLLCHLLEAGLGDEKEGVQGSILSALSPEGRSELRGIIDEFLGKSGLAEFYQKLKLLA